MGCLLCGILSFGYFLFNLKAAIYARYNLILMLLLWVSSYMIISYDMSTDDFGWIPMGFAQLCWQN